MSEWDLRDPSARRTAPDFMQDTTKILNDIHDDYLKYKKDLQSDYHISYSMQVSIFPQWGAPNGGPGWRRGWR